MRNSCQRLARVCSMRRYERVQRSGPISQTGTAHSMHSAQAHAQAVQYSTYNRKKHAAPGGGQRTQERRALNHLDASSLIGQQSEQALYVAITQPAAKPITAWNTADACRAYQGSRVSGGTRRTAARRRMRSAGGKASPRSHRRGTARCAVPWYPQARPISPYESRRAVRRS